MVLDSTFWGVKMEEQEKEFLASLQQAIHEAWGEGDLRLWKRLKAISLYQKKYGSEEICMAIDVSRRSVFYWLKRYKAFGVEGLQEVKHPGRPKRIGNDSYRPEKIQSQLTFPE